MSPKPTVPSIRPADTVHTTVHTIRPTSIEARMDPMMVKVLRAVAK